MANQQDVGVARAVARLFAAFPRLRPEQTRESAAAYAAALADLPAPHVEQAVRDAISECEYLPPVARIRELVRERHPPANRLPPPERVASATRRYSDLTDDEREAVDAAFARCRELLTRTTE